MRGCVCFIKVSLPGIVKFSTPIRIRKKEKIRWNYRSILSAVSQPHPSQESVRGCVRLIKVSLPGIVKFSTPIRKVCKKKKSMEFIGAFFPTIAVSQNKLHPSQESVRGCVCDTYITAYKKHIYNRPKLPPLVNV